MRSTYIYGERRPSLFSRSVCVIGNGFALLGGVALVARIIDTMFFNNNGLISLLIWIWEITNNV